MIKFSVILSSFTISLAYAHPNHMTHEDVQHNAEQTSAIYRVSEKMAHKSMEEKLGHSEILPCTEQHKEMPCKKK